MKSMIKPLAAAVSLALMSAAAHAQLAAPVMGAAAPASDQQLILAIWDNADSVSQVVSLNYSFADLTAANLNPTSASSPYTLAANPSGTGSVYQLNFGIVPGWTTNFANPTTQGTQYLLASAGPTNTDITSSTVPSLSLNFLADTLNATQAEVNSWASVAGTAGSFVDTTGGSTLSVQNSYLLSGLMGTVVDQFGASVGTALNFYNNAQPSARGITNAVTTAFAGFWNLSSSGQLTYNVPAAISAVPLPAALWLFASGVAGLGTIGRRRRATAA